MSYSTILFVSIFMAPLILNNNTMILQKIPLVNDNWNNGVFMIAVFALVCVILITAVILFMNSGKKKTEGEN